MADPYLPPGCPGPERSVVTYVCGDCTHDWEVSLTTELGQTFADNDDDTERCPSCHSVDVGAKRAFSWLDHVLAMSDPE